MASSAPAYRDEAHDGYVYRQYPSGDILILTTPQGRKNIKVTRKNNFKAWAAITDAIGTWEDYKKGLTKKRFLQGGKRVVTAILDEVLKTQGATRPSSEAFIPSEAASVSTPPLDIPLPASPAPPVDATQLPIPLILGAVFSIVIFGFAFLRRSN